jgi:hypothetical protein
MLVINGRNGLSHSSLFSGIVQLIHFTGIMLGHLPVERFLCSGHKYVIGIKILFIFNRVMSELLLTLFSYSWIVLRCCELSNYHQTH